MNTFRILTDFVDETNPNQFYTLYEFAGETAGMLLMKHNFSEVNNGVRTFNASEAHQVSSLEEATQIFERQARCA